MSYFCAKKIFAYQLGMCLAVLLVSCGPLSFHFNFRPMAILFVCFLWEANRTLSFMSMSYFTQKSLILRLTLFKRFFLWLYIDRCLLTLLLYGAILALSVSRSLSCRFVLKAQSPSLL